MFLETYDERSLEEPIPSARPRRKDFKQVIVIYITTCLKQNIIVPKKYN